MANFSAWTPDIGIAHAFAENTFFFTVDTYHAANTCFDGRLNSLHPMAFLAGKGSNETYTFSEMLKQPDASDFIKAMMKEANDHETRSHWTIIPRSAMPKDMKTILSIWSFKRKRLPDGHINKIQSSPLCLWWNADLVCELLGDLFTYG